MFVLSAKEVEAVGTMATAALVGVIVLLALWGVWAFVTWRRISALSGRLERDAAATKQLIDDSRDMSRQNVNSLRKRVERLSEKIFRMQTSPEERLENLVRCGGTRSEWEAAWEDLAREKAMPAPRKPKHRVEAAEVAPQTNLHRFSALIQASNGGAR